MNGRVLTNEHGYISPDAGALREDDSVAMQVASVRATLYAAVRDEELAEIDREIEMFERDEGITSAELAERLARGELAMTMRRAWWLARWRLKGRLQRAS